MKANKTTFPTITNPDTHDFFLKFPKLFPSKITKLQPLSKINYHIYLIKAISAPSLKIFTVSDKILMVSYPTTNISTTPILSAKTY